VTAKQWFGKRERGTFGIFLVRKIPSDIGIFLEDGHPSVHQVTDYDAKDIQDFFLKLIQQGASPC
jgi:hypothetical protein